jgi:glycine/D-amino acid oxidase-like deaminating enzyme/ketosteroid isomerase-like protein
MSRQLTAADLKATFDAFNRHDIDAVMTHFADDCVFFTVAGEHEYGNRIEGKDAIAKAFVGVWTAMPDVQWADHSHFLSEDGTRGVSQWTFRATNPDGTRTEVRASICSASRMARSSRNRRSANSARPFRRNEAPMKSIDKRPGSVPFDPLYDPMTASGLGPKSDYAPTYWIGTAGPAPEDDGPVTGDMDVDVAVIGSGYTGLSTAIHLAKMHGIKAVVLEANGVAYGCSTRNGGQAQISSGRLKRSQWIDRWGLDVARGMHAEVVEGFDLFRGLIRDHAIDCDPQDGGHYYIAHKAASMPALESETRLLNETFGYGARMLSRDELHDGVARDMEAHGAMWEPDGTGIHAAKLAFGYLRVARELGAKVHTDSPVQGWQLKDGVHHLRTPGGTVRARRVAVATAAYAPRGLHPRLKDRLMPIMSNSVVTRVLTRGRACSHRHPQAVAADRYAHPAPLLSPVAGQPASDRFARRHHRPRCGQPRASERPARGHGPQVPRPARDRAGLQLVGLGRCQP